VFSLLDNVISSRQAMVALAGVQAADDAEFNHAVNVAVLSLALGAELSDDPRFLDGLGVGALLHDVGKFEAHEPAEGEPVDIREHPALGAERTARLPGLDRAAIVVIYEHHQGADGSGYPPPAEGHRQSLAARIVAVADAYDRLTVTSGDAPRRLPDEAMAVLAGRAGHDLDEDVVRLFIRQLSLFTRGSVVRLTSGESAVVLEVGADPVRPLVSVVTTPEGTRLAEARRVDLSEAPDGPTVAASVDASQAGIDPEEYL
jgi:putative nucleotidyltransferase with HDIG domain